MPRIFCFAFCLGLLPAPSFAQYGGLDELYGEGVHRYFSGDVFGADELLTQVVDSGSQDPRAYYFRGLARELMGSEGEMDFEQGARLEAEGKRVVDVGNALSRIQGTVRSQIEVARRDARIEVRQQQLLLQRTRQPSGEAIGSQPSVVAPASPMPANAIPANETGLAPLVAPAGPTPATPAAPAAPAPAATEPADTSDPFADDAAPTTDAANPFGAPATPATPAAPATDAADPFGASTTPATPTTPATEAADPFGESPAPETTTADPFDPATEPATPASPTADPFDASADDAEDNPFGQ